MTAFILRAGRAPRHEFYAPYNGHPCWTDDRASAFAFEDRADAEHVRGALMLVDGSLEIAVIPADPRAAQQDEAKRQMEDERIAALHEAGMLTRANVEAVAAVNAAAEW